MAQTSCPAGNRKAPDMMRWFSRKLNWSQLFRHQSIIRFAALLISIVHTTEELELLFDRVEALLDRPRGEGEAPIISLVLHGPEVDFFALKNYERYRHVVDRAAKLAAFGAIDISICQTQMQQRGIGRDEVPAFLHQVPFGPEEVESLRGQGYVAM